MPVPIPRPLAGARPLLVVLLALAALVAACAGGGSGPGVVSLTDPSATPNASASPSASVDPEEAMLDFQRCMQDHGIDVQVATDSGGAGKVDVRVTAPRGGTDGAQPSGEAPDGDKVRAADEACRHLLPAGGIGNPDATLDPAVADEMLKFSQCMRDHGIDFPDPEFSGGGVTMGIGKDSGVDPSSPQFQAAQEACGGEAGGPFSIGKGPAASPAQP